MLLIEMSPTSVSTVCPGVEQLEECFWALWACPEVEGAGPQTSMGDESQAFFSVVGYQESGEWRVGSPGWEEGS